MADVFQLDGFTIRRKLFSLIDVKFHVYDSAENVVGFCLLKGFKLKEDVRIFSGEDMGTQLLQIGARSVIDFGATYDVSDARTGERVGSLRRKGIKSILRDEWHVFDAAGSQIGVIREDHLGLALLRRLLGGIIPQSYDFQVGGVEAMRIAQRFNPFILKMDCSFRNTGTVFLDRRLGLAAALLLCAIEGRQE
ncbi:MAG: hypothetical protein SF028_01545 [Candidatus Sumerlaeia bacterium]|nr:hypothetical protein [Candidatus Sumerlaeia bacterium]